MSCCNAFGECHGGPGCMARSVPQEAPELHEVEELSPVDSLVEDIKLWAVSFAQAALIILAASVLACLIFWRWNP